MNIGTATVISDRPVHGLPTAPRKRRKDATRQSERSFMEQVVALAKLNGWFVYHTHNSQRSEPGFPDLVMVRGRRLIIAELKRDGCNPTDAQRKWLAALGKTCADVWLWRPLDWAVIERELTRASE